MGKTLVVYKSKYGFTKKYAEWLAQELGASICPAEKTKISDLQACDTIIYGGGIYVGSVNGISIIKKAFEKIKDKNIYLFTVGLGDVTEKEYTDNIREQLEKALTQEMLNKIKVFHFRGGMDYPRLGLLHRTMMGVVMSVLNKKPESELSAADKQMLQCKGKTVDLTDRDSIRALVDAVKESGGQ